jgi:ABC-type branched-subunit amino acid transport system ATPase component
VGLIDQSFSFASDLTRYEQRCLEIARGLAMDPQILLIDEPADGMNTQQQHALAGLLKDVCKGALTLVVTSAGSDPFVLICDRTVHLSTR